jgi:hypothetical protein
MFLNTGGGTGCICGDAGTASSFPYGWDDDPAIEGYGGISPIDTII